MVLQHKTPGFVRGQILERELRNVFLERARGQAARHGETVVGANNMVVLVGSSSESALLRITVMVPPNKAFEFVRFAHRTSLTLGRSTQRYAV